MRKESRKNLTDRRSIKILKINEIDPHGDYQSWVYWKVTHNWKYYRKTQYRQKPD